MRIPVIYRRERRKDGEVIAVFPTLPADPNGTYCTLYAHIGQHHGGDYYHVMATTRPATPAEYADLTRELETQAGYAPPELVLVPMLRASWAMHEQRRHAAQEV